MKAAGQEHSVCVCVEEGDKSMTPQEQGSLGGLLAVHSLISH